MNGTGSQCAHQCMADIEKKEEKCVGEAEGNVRKFSMLSIEHGDSVLIIFDLVSSEPS